MLRSGTLYFLLHLCIYRFVGDEENGAKAAWEKAVQTAPDGKVLYQEKEITARVLEGEEEEAYWNAFNEKKQNRNASSRGRGR